MGEESVTTIICTIVQAVAVVFSLGWTLITYLREDKKHEREITASKKEHQKELELTREQQLIDMEEASKRRKQEIVFSYTIVERLFSVVNRNFDDIESWMEKKKGNLNTIKMDKDEIAFFKDKKNKLKRQVMITVKGLNENETDTFKETFETYEDEILGLCKVKETVRIRDMSRILDKYRIEIVTKLIHLEILV